MKLSDLKKSLAECHLTSRDEKVKFLLEITDPSYFLNRILECVHECQSGNEILENTKLGIQLFNLFRVAHKEYLAVPMAGTTSENDDEIPF